MALKQCTECKEWKSPDGFGKDKTGRNGLRSQCRDCRNKIESKRAKGVRVRTNQTHGYQPRKPSRPAGMPDWLYEIKIWFKKMCRREYRANNLDKWRESSRKYRENNLEKERARINMKERTRRAQIKSSGGGNITAAQWQELKEQYNYTCLKCKRREPDIVITLDHVKPLAMGGTHTIENAQPLCHSCNSSKQARWIDYR
jgi:5-methylcytosine-specific restriction endonuclease McrA